MERFAELSKLAKVTGNVSGPSKILAVILRGKS
jgi:hypothetical protein